MPFGLTSYGRRERKIIGVTLIYTDAVSSDDDRTIDRTPSPTRKNTPIAEKWSQMAALIRGYPERRT
jgi:hypothetical protein